jgi:hypothetical protein
MYSTLYMYGNKQYDHQGSGGMGSWVEYRLDSTTVQYNGLNAVLSCPVLSCPVLSSSPSQGWDVGTRITQKVVHVRSRPVMIGSPV